MHRLIQQLGGEDAPHKQVVPLHSDQDKVHGHRQGPGESQREGGLCRGHGQRPRGRTDYIDSLLIYFGLVDIAICNRDTVVLNVGKWYIVQHYWILK